MEDPASIAGFLSLLSSVRAIQRAAACRRGSLNNYLETKSVVVAL